MILLSRSEAKAQGASHYFTGKPCVLGHIAPRRVQNGGCQVCLNERSAAWRLSNEEKAITASRRWRQINKGRVNKDRSEFRATDFGKKFLAAQRKDLYEKNKEKHQIRAREHYHANKEKYSERFRQYALNNVGYMRARCSARRAGKLQAMPNWVDATQIRQIYAECPSGMHVDHIVPLKGVMPNGSRVSGLHVPWNLRYLSASANMARKNRVSSEEQMELENASH